MCTTDMVVALGLDLGGATHVINYDMPTAKGEAGIEEYIQRIGRVALHSKKGGEATTFFTEQDQPLAALLVACLPPQNVSEELAALAALPVVRAKNMSRKARRAMRSAAIAERVESVGGGGGRGGKRRARSEEGAEQGGAKRRRDEALTRRP
jgi:superfamily II DNA/RNA helicase